ncbi:hypothetical protein LOY64_09175 [Pseudomonas corrugata]|uniref:hypothetical protein n=1 Tax=Pseudomonas corrugata TaxID=47879 RepID=UPI00222FE13F|nr:hypothetical protein [Pseudomonas corrugata]UZD97152.1 hypothetical protein LOY64_09175 [Pseudomonas corrugata]
MAERLAQLPPSPASSLGGSTVDQSKIALSRQMPKISPCRISSGCAIIMISFPHQLLHALCALQHDRETRGIDTGSRALLVVWSYRESDHAPRSKARQFFESALLAFPYIECRFLSPYERRFALSPFRKLTSRANWIRKIFSISGGEQLSFYYPHDASRDHTAQAFMQALQAEKNICYGDAPGFLYSSKKPSSPSPQLSLRWLKELFWLSRIKDTIPWLAAESALIAVNFNEWEEHNNLPYPIEIPSSIFTPTLASLKSAFSQIADFEEKLSKQSLNVSTAILILSNFTNSKLTNQRNELALYRSICKANLRTGDYLYIKKHAGTSQAFMSKLLAVLKDYQVEAFPTSLEHIPIELFTDLHRSCQIISVSSASALFSLIPGTHTNHALTEEHINLYFNPPFRSHMITANNRILQKSHSNRQAFAHTNEK